MKRSGTPDIASDTKRFEAYPPPLMFQQQQLRQQQQQLNFAQQQQSQAQQHLPYQQYQSQQQQQFQNFHQMQLAQQQQQQQQQQYAASQQFYNQSAYYAMTSVQQFQQFSPPQSQMMFNNSPSWNYLTPPPQFYNPPPSSVPPNPPLPPPDIKPEKPPLPKDPEPGMNSLNQKNMGGGNPGTNFNGSGGLRAPGSAGGLGLMGLNGLNGGMFPGFNGGGRVPPANSNGIMHGPPPIRGRRRNPHFFPQPLMPLMELQTLTDYNEFAHLVEEDQPAGPEKLTIYLNSADTGRVQVNKKAKRKPMSTRYTRTKLWIREEAEAAIALEKEFNRMQKRPMLILKFPDPDLNKYIVKKYSTSIDTVHFQQPSTPRYCFVQLKENSDVESVINTIREIPFGTGKISAELKNQHMDDQPVTPEEIDPYTLYIGNLPTHISVRVVKQYFPNAQRIDIGYAQRMRYTRYAFIRYNTVSEAMESYRRTVNALLDSRSLIVRFRRQKGNIGLPGETKPLAPRREGREILPNRNPKPLEKDQDDHDDHDDEDFPEEGDLEPLEEDGEDEEDDIERENVTVKEAVVNPVPVGLISSNDPAPADSENHSSKAAPKKTEQTTSNKSMDLIETPKKPSKTADETIVKQTQKEPSTSKASSTPNESVRTTKDMDQPVNLSEFIAEDRKDNVLEEANKLMKKKNSHTSRERSESPVVIGSFPPVKRLIDVKSEPDDDSDDSSDSSGINLLGTRVKDEPYEDPNGPPTHGLDDPFQDDYEYDDIDGEPEEEDDEDWTHFRRNELNAEENKPDLEQLDIISKSVNAAPIAADLEPKPEFYDEHDIFEEQTKNKHKKNTDTFTEKDVLSDMFAQLNSDTECDDDDAFFGI